MAANIMICNLKNPGFESETQLVQAIVSYAKRTYRRGYNVELEVDAGVGVADVVLAKRAPHSTKALKSLGGVTPRLAILLSQEIGGSITNRSALAASLGTSESAAQRVLLKLSVAGVARRSGVEVNIRTIKAPPFESIIAVEAKIRDWQRVLIQAYRNLQFADESWVVLDHACIRPALLHKDRFERAGVGLASMSRVGELVIHSNAARQGPVSPAKRWQAQAVLASRVLMRRVHQGPDFKIASKEMAQ